MAKRGNTCFKRFFSQIHVYNLPFFSLIERLYVSWCANRSVNTIKCPCFDPIFIIFRKSFPSGHAAIAGFGMIYLVVSLFGGEPTSQSRANVGATSVQRHVTF